MNFTPREKKLLTLLAVVFVVVLYTNLFLRPQLAAINTLKGEIAKYTQTYDMNIAVMKKVQKMDSDIKIISQKLKDLRAIYPPVMNYDEVLVEVRDLAKNSGIDVVGVDFDEASVLKQQEDAKDTSGGANAGKQSSNGGQGEIKITDSKLKSVLDTFGISDSMNADGDIKNQGKNVKIPDGKAYSISIKLSATGTNDEIKSFLYSVADLKNKVELSDIKISNGAGGVLAANMALNFYGIMDKNAGQYTMLQDGTWVPGKASGAENMFKPYDGYTGQIGQGGANEETTTKSAVFSPQIQDYDFSMRVMPFGNNMAPPTVSIVGRDIIPDAGNLGVPNIYGDNKGQEKVEFYIEEKNGSFYCKFRTESEAFPDAQYTQLAQFKPAGDEIKLLISSTQRQSKDDAAGVNVNLINKTSKKFVVKVTNEDASNPRVKINKSGGNIEVSY